MLWINQATNQMAKAKGYDNVMDMDLAEHPDAWSTKTTPTLGGLLKTGWSALKSAADPVLDQVKTGIENWWYKNTGQAHLTSEYQHEEQLANTAIQREAKDREAAGLSKYGGVGGASSPTPSSGNSLLATALSLQQLKAGNLALKEQSYNFNKAKSWGVPTTAVDQFAQYSALSKLLFGKDVPDMVGEGGLIQQIGDFFKGLGSNFFGGGSMDAFANGANQGAGFLPSGKTEPLFPDVWINQQYPALFQNPEFLSAIFKEDGVWKVPQYYWNLMKDDAEVANMTIDDYASLLSKFLSSGTGKKMYNDAISNYYSSGTGNGAAGGGGHAW